MARRFGVPVLCLAQLNRDTEHRKDSRPTLADLRETGAAENDADGVFLLYRPDYYQEWGTGQAAESSVLEVNVAKHRHGRTGSCKLKFDLAKCKISERWNSFSTDDFPKKATTSQKFANSSQKRTKQKSQFEPLPVDEDCPFLEEDPQMKLE
jgi:replicative DNA helicase